MRKIHIDAWCDYCWADGEKESPAEHTFAVGALESTRVRPSIRTLETCEVHAKEIAEFIGFISKLPLFEADVSPAPPKRRVSDQPPSAQPVDCPICMVEQGSRTGLISHVWHIHRTDKRPPYPKRCPDCGIEAQATGLAQHRRFVHGYDPLEDALSGAAGYVKVKKRR